jgi:hypothetical protein
MFASREAISSLLSADGDIFTPAMAETDRRRLKDGWDRAVRACRAFGE